MKKTLILLTIKKINLGETRKANQEA